MNIWFNKNISIDKFGNWRKDTMVEHLGMEFVEIGDDFLKASMPVDARTKQAYGLLHGGASVALAETIGSIASILVVDHDKFMCVGLEINANHVRSAKEGIVIATCKPLHIGKATHVWDIKIHDQQERLICISRITVAVLKRRDID